jgi:hypothetical protein
MVCAKLKGFALSVAMLGSFLISGCSTDRRASELYGPSEAGVLVIDALLLVDQPLPDLFVLETVAPGDSYSLEGAAVRDAVVEISTGGTTFTYAADVDSAGRYLPQQNHIVLPETVYTLRVSSQGREATGTTLTPEQFQIRESLLLNEGTLQVDRVLKTFRDGLDAPYVAPENQVEYLDGLLEARFDRGNTPGYQVGIISLDEGSERVLDADFLDEDDYDDLERHASSPPFEAPDGSVRLPWFAVYFAGRHVIRIHALDENWFNFARSSPESQEGNFGGLAGDSFERPLFSVTGGIGLFGSAAMDSIGFNVLPRQ